MFSPAAFPRIAATRARTPPTANSAVVTTKGYHGSKYAGMDDQPRSEGNTQQSVATSAKAENAVPSIAHQSRAMSGDAIPLPVSLGMFTISPNPRSAAEEAVNETWYGWDDVLISETCPSVIEPREPRWESCYD